MRETTEIRLNEHGDEAMALSAQTQGELGKRLAARLAGRGGNMIDTKPLALALAKIATGEVPLGQYSDMISAVQVYAAETLDEQGIEADVAEIEAWL